MLHIAIFEYNSSVYFTPHNYLLTLIHWKSLRRLINNLYLTLLSCVSLMTNVSTQHVKYVMSRDGVKRYSCIIVTKQERDIERDLKRRRKYMNLSVYINKYLYLYGRWKIEDLASILHNRHLIYLEWLCKNV